MRILHVGWGFTPWRPGGLITYAEDLMAAQAARGHHVAYFCAGRHYPWLRRARVRRWSRRGVTIHELVNSPIVAGMELGTRDPIGDIEQPEVERAFAQVLAAERPDVVHVQELHGLTSSLLDVATEAGVPALMTLQDYFPLCPTLRLFDIDGKLCLQRETGAECAVRTAMAPTGPGPAIHRTLEYEVRSARERLHLPDRLDFTFLRPAITRVIDRLSRPAEAGSAPPPAPPTPDPGLARDFQRRRDVNVERLGRVGRLVAQSARVAELYRLLGVRGERMVTMPFTLAHIERLRPRRVAAVPQVPVFATLNGCVSPSKGSTVVLDAVRALRAAGLGGRFELRVHGFVDWVVREELASFDEVELLGLYPRDALDAMLDDVDVGLMPSVWEEALGYTGLELLAKGIPLVANPVGGIVEYAREGETAWLNHGSTGAGLAEIMARLIEDPAQIVAAHERVLARRDEVVISFAAHVDALERLYGELQAEWRSEHERAVA